MSGEGLFWGFAELDFFLGGCEVKNSGVPGVFIGFKVF